MPNPDKTRIPTALTFGSTKDGEPILPLACGDAHDREELARVDRAIRRQLADVTALALAGTSTLGAGRIVEARAQIEALLLRMVAWGVNADDERRELEAARSVPNLAHSDGSV